MCALKWAVFDLDGTLTQSEEGIWNCVRHTAQMMGLPQPDDVMLRKMIGPPLRWSFKELMGLNDEDADRAVVIYRERFNRVGLFENRVYPGIRRLFRTLKQEGWCVAVATGKPEIPAKRIVEYFGLSKWIDRLVGTSEKMGPEKPGLIRAVLPEEYDEAWMVGDRRFDVEGGRAVGIHTIGVGYGYGSEEELRNAGCEVYCEMVQQVIDTLCPGAKPPKGQFLSMEGLDGCGKSTQLKYLTDGLERYGYEVVHSREPGGCPVAERIREVILDPSNKGMTAETEALLYAASRAQNVREVIRPCVAAGKLLLCDRFIDSSVAYQGGARGLGVQAVLDINAPAVDGTLPDVTVFLDLDHEESLARRHSATAPDRIEQEGEAFFTRVEEAYHELIARDPGRYVVVNAAGEREQIAEEVLRGTLEKLWEAET